MDARATFSGSQSSTRFVSLLIAAVVAALILGGAGGYVVRGLNMATSTPTTTTHPFVIEQAPYSSPVVSPSPEPTRDPNGFAVPI